MRPQASGGGSGGGGAAVPRLLLHNHSLTSSPTAPQCHKQVNLKYMKKSARDEARAAFKQQAKAAKRAKLDPEQAKGTLALQKEAAAAQAAQQNGAVGSGSEDDDEEGSEGSSSGDDSDAEQSRKQRRLAGAADGVQQQRQRQGAVGQLAIPNGEHCTVLCWRVGSFEAYECHACCWQPCRSGQPGCLSLAPNQLSLPPDCCRQAPQP